MTSLSLVISLLDVSLLFPGRTFLHDDRHWACLEEVGVL